MGQGSNSRASRGSGAPKGAFCRPGERRDPQPPMPMWRENLPAVKAPLKLKSQGLWVAAFAGTTLEA